MKQDPNDAPETVGAVLSDVVETLYKLRAERATEPAPDPAGAGRAQAYLERDRFKQRFLRALLGSLEASK